jgi:hypothetical protein
MTGSKPLGQTDELLGGWDSLIPFPGCGYANEVSEALAGHISAHANTFGAGLFDALAQASGHWAGHGLVEHRLGLVAGDRIIDS